jgi:hypothetical protein
MIIKAGKESVFMHGDNLPLFSKGLLEVDSATSINMTYDEIGVVSSLP